MGRVDPVVFQNNELVSQLTAAAANCDVLSNRLNIFRKVLILISRHSLEDLAVNRLAELDFV